jgi:hypothetical protein
MTVVSHGFMVSSPCHVSSLAGEGKPAAAGAAGGQCIKPYKQGVLGPLYSDKPFDGPKQVKDNLGGDETTDGTSDSNLKGGTSSTLTEVEIGE